MFGRQNYVWSNAIFITFSQQILHKQLLVGLKVMLVLSPN